MQAGYKYERANLFQQPTAGTKEAQPRKPRAKPGDGSAGDLEGTVAVASTRNRVGRPRLLDSSKSGAGGARLLRSTRRTGRRGVKRAARGIDSTYDEDLVETLEGLGLTDAAEAAARSLDLQGAEDRAREDRRWASRARLPPRPPVKSPHTSGAAGGVLDVEAVVVGPPPKAQAAAVSGPKAAAASAAVAAAAPVPGRAALPPAPVEEVPPDVLNKVRRLGGSGEGAQ